MPVHSHSPAVGLPRAPSPSNYTVGGTAAPSDDYEALSGSVVVPTGQRATTVSVTAHQDGQVESDEDVTVSLSPYSTYFVAGSSSDSILITDG